MAPARDATESTALLRAANELDVARHRRRRATIASVAVVAVAVASIVARGRASREGAGAPFEVQFQVDVGCIELDVVDRSPLEDFYGSDIASVRLLRRGDDPIEEFGGASRRAGGVELTQSGWSTIYVGRARVRAGEEIGFGLVNARGETIFELGHNKRFPATGELANATCLANVPAGGGVYRNRVIPKSRACGSSTACVDSRRRGLDVSSGAR